MDVCRHSWRPAGKTGHQGTPLVRLTLCADTKLCAVSDCLHLRLYASSLWDRLPAASHSTGLCSPGKERRHDKHRHLLDGGKAIKDLHKIVGVVWAEELCILSTPSSSLSSDQSFPDMSAATHRPSTCAAQLTPVEVQGYDTAREWFREHGLTSVADVKVIEMHAWPRLPHAIRKHQDAANARLHVRLYLSQPICTALPATAPCCPSKPGRGGGRANQPRLEAACRGQVCG